MLIALTAVIGTVFASGLVLTSFYDLEKGRDLILIVLGSALVGAAGGAMFGLFITAVTGDECAEGQVHVSPARNSAGASGCVPVDVLPEIAK